MRPRLPQSKKWTAFPKDYLEQIKEVFAKGFEAHLEPNQSFVVEGRIYPEEILLRIGLKEEGRLAQANFEVSSNYKNDEHDAMSRIHDCVDAAAGMLQEYIEAEGHIDLPAQWKEFEFNKKSLFLQFNRENSELEAEADRILQQAASTSLVTDLEDIPDSEDALDKVDELIDPEMVKKLRH